MKFKIYYDKTLKMSEGKLAAQVAHVSKELGRMTQSNPREDIIIVLGLSHTKFNQMLQMQPRYTFWYSQVDLGMTEVAEGAVTACGYVEEY